MAVTVILEMQVKPESAGEIAQAMKGAFPDTRAYDGCTSIVANANLDDANNIVLVQNWESRPHHERYLKWRTETGFFEAMSGMLEGEPQIRYFEALDA